MAQGDKTRHQVDAFFSPARLPGLEIFGAAYEKQARRLIHEPQFFLLYILS